MITSYMEIMSAIEQCDSKRERGVDISKGWLTISRIHSRAGLVAYVYWQKRKLSFSITQLSSGGVYVVNNSMCRYR